MLLESNSFPFDPEQAKKLMVTSLVEYFLANNGNVHSASIIGASRIDQSRIFTPGMNKDISCRYYFRSTFRNDVGEADKLDATFKQSSTDEWNTASSQIEEGTPKSIFRKVVKQFDSGNWMNLANSLAFRLQSLYLSGTRPCRQTM